MLGGALSNAACAVSEPQAELTDAAAAMVVNGTIDATAPNAQFPATVRLGNTGCGGTLVTPYWVVTAQHCYDEAGQTTAPETIQLGANLDVSIARDLTMPIQLWAVYPIEHRENDLALIRLSAPAKPPFAVPSHLPLSSCGTFSGQLVGFGPDFYNENGYGSVCTGSSSTIRRFGIPVLWMFNDGSAIGGTYRHTFESDPYEGCTDMTGIGVGGDSGASLYRSSDKQICAVVSGDGFWACDTIVVGSVQHHLECEYHTVALDDDDAADWWSQFVVDVDGNWEGEEPINNVTDPDGDGIPSSTDNCPHVYNPEQLTTFDDPDGNGLGAACDACPGLPASEQLLNRNKEVELAVFAPTATNYPVLKRSDFASDAAFSAAVAANLAAFVPDACDPFPAPTVSLQEGGDLPAAVTGPTEAAESWPCLSYVGGCELTFKNKIVINPKSSPLVDASGGTNETIGLRWCDCQTVAGFNNSVSGRSACRNHPTALCQFNETQYDQSNSKWLKLTTKVGTSWTNPTLLGGEWVKPAGDAPFSVLWDFTAFGPTHVSNVVNSLSVTGMLWTHVRDLSSQSLPSPLTQANVRKFANALDDGGAHKTLGPKGHMWVAINDWIECPMCLFGVQQVVHERTNPWWRRVTDAGLDVTTVADATTRAHFDAVDAGTRLHVPASEPVPLLGSYFAPTQSYARALGLSTSGEVVTKLVSTQLNQVPAAQAMSTSGGPTFVKGPGLAFSAIGQRLYVLGGLDEQEQPTNKGWFFDLGNSTWREFTMPDGEEVGIVPAMVYRHQDRAIYFLDLSEGTLTLRRWHAQRNLKSGVLRTLATFPSSWGNFARHDLVVGPLGDLAVVAWKGSGSQKTRIARFATNAGHQLTAAGISRLTDSLLSPPTMTGTHLVMTVLPERPAASAIGFGAMSTDWANDAPTILAH